MKIIGNVAVNEGANLPDYRATLSLNGGDERKTERAIRRWTYYSNAFCGADSLTAVGMTLRLAKAEGDYDLALAIIRAKRAGQLAWLTVTQQSWRTKVSRRPARGRHHDSWEIREKYARCIA